MPLLAAFDKPWFPLTLVSLNLGFPIFCKQGGSYEGAKPPCKGWDHKITIGFTIFFVLATPTLAALAAANFPILSAAFC
jgi:hypothetical protein